MKNDEVGLVVVKVAAAAVAVAKMVSRGVVPLRNLEVSVCGKVGLFVLRENWSCVLVVVVVVVTCQRILKRVRCCPLLGRP